MLLLFSSEESVEEKGWAKLEPQKEIKETLEGKSLTATANFA
jgi:hypothetical protein